MKILILLSVVALLEAVRLDNPKSDLLPAKEECGVNSGKYPWMAFLPLKSRVHNPDANLRCAGVLISKRYVAISKNCLQFVLTIVQLGRYDTTIKEDFGAEYDIEERAIDDNIDIVLLRLSRDVEMNDKIRPICLPFDGIKRASIGDVVYSSGWGLVAIDSNTPSSVKKNVKEALVDNQECKSAGIGILKDEDMASSVCARHGDDSPDIPCNGDEGSPLMYESDGRWVLEGILTSVFNQKGEPCALGSPVRAAKITEKVLEWIVNKIH